MCYRYFVASVTLYPSFSVCSDPIPIKEARNCEKDWKKFQIAQGISLTCAKKWDGFGLYCSED